MASTALARLFEDDPRVVCSYLYGSALRPDFLPDQSDVDILIVVNDTTNLDDFLDISLSVRARIMRAEVTVLRAMETEAGIHPGGSRHFFFNVAKSGVRLYGPDVLASASAESPTLDEAYRRLVQLCQRARLVIVNPSKFNEANFWLAKYQRWIPLCLMELLELHGAPEDRVRAAHDSFCMQFPAVAQPSLTYPYTSLHELQGFLEKLVAWIPQNVQMFADDRVDNHAPRKGFSSVPGRVPN